jgi:hypothetical protein
VKSASIRVGPGLLGIASAALAGCSLANDAASVDRHVEDGVEVVVSHAPASRPEQWWRLSDEPTLRIGDDDSLGEGYLFSGISGATRLPDGRVVIADRVAAELRFFDSTGRLLQVVGRRGQGPGEFAWIFNLLRCDEHAVHAVGPDASISIFDLTGKFERRFFPADRAGVPVRQSFVCGRDGELVATTRNRDQPGKQGLYRTTANLILIDSNRDSGAVDLGAFFIQERFAGAGGSSSHPLGKQTSVAIARDRIYVGTGDRYEVTAFDRKGRPVQRVRRDVQPAPLDGAAVARYLDSWVESVPPADRPLTRQRFSDGEHPDTYPAHARLLGDTRGYLWVQSFPRDARAATDWSVFGADGVWLGNLQLPANFHALEIGDDYVLGRFTGELGQESIRVYALER